MHAHQREPRNCEDCGRLLVFYAWEELETHERAAVEEHTRQCPACAALLAREIQLRAALAQVERPAEKLDPAGLLLAQCRSQLGEALDDAAEPRSGRTGWAAWHPASWLAPSLVAHPVRSVVLLVFLGVLVGAGVPQWYRARMAPPSGTPVIVSAFPRLSEQDLQTMGIAGINWFPDGSGSPSVELHLTAEKPLVVRGSLDDSEVKRVLTYVVQNGQRFDSGVRLDSLEVLRTRSGDGDVRRALCTAARRDTNPGVRLKALEALGGLEQDEQVRQTLLDALLNDSNPGVRVEAINALRALAEKGGPLDDQRLVNVLRDRMRKDPNNYIRMQSAAAIRQLGPRGVY